MIRKILTVLAVVCLIVISLFVYHHLTRSQVAYVDIPRIFSRFEMKKEFEAKYKKTADERRRVLDSLAMDLQLLAKRLDRDSKNPALIQEFDLKREYYIRRKSQTEEDNTALSGSYDKRILEQMSQYIADYGKENQMDVILGTEGNGSLMYADPRLDISEQIIGYINDRYKGL